MADTFTFTRSIVVDAPARRDPPVPDRLSAVGPLVALGGTRSGPASGVLGCRVGGVGAKYAWSGNKKAGRGAMEITRVDAPREVEVRLDFEKPMKATNTVTFELTPPQGEATRVAWVMVGKHTLFSRIGGLFGFFEKMLGKDFEKGLAQLKAVSESR